MRLENGFFSTQQERDAFNARQEKNMKALAESMGITVPRARTKKPKFKPNEMCPVGRWVLSGAVFCTQPSSENLTCPPQHPPLPRLHQRPQVQKVRSYIFSVIMVHQYSPSSSSSSSKVLQPKRPHVRLAERRRHGV